MKHRLSLPTYSCLLFLLCFSTGNAQTVSTSDLSSVKKIIEERNRQYFTAIEKNDVKSFAAQFLEDCWIMEPNVPAYCGLGAVSDYFDEILLKKQIARGRLITIDLYSIGTDIVAEVGFYQFYDKSNEQFDDGEYIVLWEKDDGQWKRLKQTMVSGRPIGFKSFK